MKINSVKKYCLLGMLAVFSSAHATPGTDIKTATTDVVFSSAVTLDHDLHAITNSFRLSDLGNPRPGGFVDLSKEVLVAQGKIRVASGAWNSADEIVAKFTAGTGLCDPTYSTGSGRDQICFMMRGGGGKEPH